jgi:hypothetical protein
MTLPPPVQFTFHAVNFYPLYLGLALALLWLPRQWLRFGVIRASRRRPRDWAPNRDRQPGDVSVRFGEEFRKARNWVDFFRALAGSVAVGGLLPGVAAFAAADPRPTKDNLHFILLLKAVVMLVSLLVQLLRVEGRVTLFAPLFFLQGLSFGFLGVPAAVLAVVGVWALNPALPSAAVFLFVLGALELVFSSLFGVSRLSMAMVVALTMMPGFVSILSKRHLAQFTKKTKIISTSSSSARD